MRTLFLCGFMGCGKTTIGQLLAKKLSVPFYDLDAYIVKKEGRSIPEIFAADGEPYFRRIEAASIGEISQNGGVIATGGGAILNPNTASLAKARGRVIFLDAPFKVCYARIAGDKNRPLVMNNTKQQLEELYNRRRTVYSENSTDTVSAKGTPEEIAEKILQNL